MATKQKRRFLKGCVGNDFKFGKGQIVELTPEEIKDFGVLTEAIEPEKKRKRLNKEDIETSSIKPK